MEKYHIKHEKGRWLKKRSSEILGDRCGIFWECRNFFGKCLKKVIQKFRQKFGPRFWRSGSASVLGYINITHMMNWLTKFIPFPTLQSIETFKSQFKTYLFKQSLTFWTLLQRPFFRPPLCCLVRFASLIIIICNDIWENWEVSQHWKIPGVTSGAQSAPILDNMGIEIWTY